MAKTMTEAKVRSVRPLCPGIFELLLGAPEIASAAVPGQFVNVYLNDPSRMLPRPISLCGADPGEGTLRLVFRVTGKGKGTDLLSRMKPGETLPVLGPLGNGFPLSYIPGPLFLVGGGIGLPPILGVLNCLRGRRADRERSTSERSIAVLGYRNSDTFLLEEFQHAADAVYTASEDGSTGVRGTVMDALLQAEQAGDVPGTMFACGPKPMLAALKRYAADRNIPLWVSMEERMACGIGVCLGCVTGSTETDAHSNVRNKRVCKDGPVFFAEEVEL